MDIQIRTKESASCSMLLFQVQTTISPPPIRLCKTRGIEESKMENGSTKYMITGIAYGERFPFTSNVPFAIAFLLISLIFFLSFLLLHIVLLFHFTPHHSFSHILFRLLFQFLLLQQWRRQAFVPYGYG